MKAFFEEYGFIALSAIVVVILIALATPVGDAIKSSVMSLVGKFSTTTNTLVDNMGNEIQNAQAETLGN